jgi:hypothetical protein
MINIDLLVPWIPLAIQLHGRSLLTLPFLRQLLQPCCLTPTLLPNRSASTWGKGLAGDKSATTQTFGAVEVVRVGGLIWDAQNGGTHDDCGATFSELTN